MQVDAFFCRGPFVTDERREMSRVIGIFRGVNRLRPRRGIGFGSRQRRERLGKCIAGYRLDDFDGNGNGILAARLDPVIPAAPGRIGEHRRLAGVQAREEAHVVRVIGDDEEVQRPRQLDLLAGRRDDLLALGEAIGVRRRQSCAERPGVHRHARVQVRVTPEHLGREIAVRIRRIARLFRKRAAQTLFARRRILREGRAKGECKERGETGLCVDSFHCGPRASCFGSTLESQKFLSSCGCHYPGYRDF